MAMHKAERASWSKVCIITCLFVILFLGVSFPGEVSARTIRVPTDYPSIQKAMDAAQSGDKVLVAQGTYYENVTMKAGVTLQGGWNKDFSNRNTAAQVTTIDGGKKGGFVVRAANNATLDGFTIINGTQIDEGDFTSGAGVQCISASMTIKNNTIRNNAPAGVYCNGSSATITNNIITNNKQAGIYFENGSSVKISGNSITEHELAGIGTGGGGMAVSSIDARNNIISHNARAGIETQAATGTIYNNIVHDNKEAGIRMVITPMEIVNNTVVSNGRAGIVAEDPSKVPTIKNNIVAFNGDAGIRAAGEGYSHNLLYANNQTEGMDPHYLWVIRRNYGGYEDEQSYLKKHGVIADPLFVDLRNHDYHVKGGSPAIDAGDPDPGYNDKNFPPSLGSDTNDVGAYGGPFAIAGKQKKNDPPKAQAQFPQQAYVGDNVKLDGTASGDPNGDAISYQWKMVTKPGGSAAQISKPQAAKPRFKVDVPGEYKVQLVVTDRWGKSSDPDTMTITGIRNRPPKANAGEVISNVYLGDKVTLYGDGSKDPDGDPLTYQWELTFKPAASKTALAGSNTTNPTLMVDALGCYEIQLVVNDGKVNSEPSTVYVSTQHNAVDGKRNVPAEYPTIQSAVDAANPGDDIIVQAGTYNENVVVDKNVDLIGIGWPTVDGGTQEGDVNTIYVPYLGDKAGKIEGFIITGGGKGGMGHGINAWDSAPTIVDNKIMRNGHVGIGVHGAGALTSRMKIYNNFIYENLIGIGNGRGNNAHIFNNYIHHNSIVGVGTRGLSQPRIEGNYIYANHIGIGAREVASPYIVGNHIYDNVCGITISPMSTVKRFASDDITIKNNLIFNNEQCGISVTSFNLSKVIIANNTIDSNNQKYGEKDRGGGIILGYPFPGEFTAVLENNIVTNNKTGGIVKYTGTDLFQAPGTTTMNDFNNVWNNDEEYIGATPGDKGFSKDPLFVTLSGEKNGNYYLSQRPNQDQESPCVDAGSSTAADAGLKDKTTRIDKVEDTGVVDLGYHYPEEVLKAEAEETGSM